MTGRLSREHVAVLAGLAAPLALTVILIPLRAGFPNTDAALALILFASFLLQLHHLDHPAIKPLDEAAIVAAAQASGRRAGYLDGINAAAGAVAVGSPPLALIDQVCEQLTGLLALSACRFQDGTAGLGGPPRLRLWRRWCRWSANASPPITGSIRCETSRHSPPCTAASWGSTR